MKSVLIRLREASSTFSAAEKTIASYILQYPEEAMHLSVHALAEKVFSSPATVVRMCRRIDFDGYREFRQALTYEMAVRQINTEKNSQEITHSDGIEDLIEKITFRNIVSLEDTKNLLDPETLQKCVDLLCSCKTILLFGIGASLYAAHDAHLKFLRMNKPCMVNDDWHSQFLQARNASSEDLAIVFSYSGETLEMVECMKALKENGTPIIAITRCVATSVSALADYKLFTTANESVFRSGAMASRISQLNIIDILFTAFVNQAYDDYLPRLAKTHIRKPGVPVSDKL